MLTYLRRLIYFLRWIGQEDQIPLLDMTREQFDAFKSSREVPREMIEEFFAWKAHTPIPETPLVSVCIGTYNRARLLVERCLPSILEQTYSNLELLVVGEACTDETERLVTRIGDPRLKFTNLPNRGPYPDEPYRRWMVAGTVPFNHAMRQARGDFITHLDDDDRYPPDRLEKLVAFAQAHKCDFIWHPFWYEDGAGHWQLNPAKQFTMKQVTTSSVFYRSWFKRIEWDIDAHLLMEPGDWNRFRRIKYINPIAKRYPEPLLWHYREMRQKVR